MLTDHGDQLLQDAAMEPCVLTDKAETKTVPCRDCERPCVISKLAPNKVLCTDCREAPRPSHGDREIVQAGRTDPAEAANLRDCLINPQFASALCPVHPDDETHVMELKWISQNPRYGPSLALGGGKFKQLGPGEVAMHQCAVCKAVVTYDTTCQVHYRRQNEVRDNKHCNRMLETLGLREEPS